MICRLVVIWPMTSKDGFLRWCFAAKLSSAPMLGCIEFTALVVCKFPAVVSSWLWAGHASQIEYVTSSLPSSSLLGFAYSCGSRALWVLARNLTLAVHSAYLTTDWLPGENPGKRRRRRRMSPMMLMANCWFHEYARIAMIPMGLAPTMLPGWYVFEETGPPRTKCSLPWQM